MPAREGPPNKTSPTAPYASARGPNKKEQPQTPYTNPKGPQNRSNPRTPYTNAGGPGKQEQRPDPPHHPDTKPRKRSAVTGQGLPEQGQPSDSVPGQSLRRHCRAYYNERVGVKRGNKRKIRRIEPTGRRITTPKASHKDAQTNSRTLLRNLHS